VLRPIYTLKEEKSLAEAVDRRAAVRFPCDLGSTCRPFALVAEAHWPGRVVNLSCGGVGLLLPRRFEAGTLLNVELQLANGARSGPLLARVIHVRYEQDGTWLVGSAWIHPLTPEELQDLFPDAV
jgi:hypothetical protein